MITEITALVSVVLSSALAIASAIFTYRLNKRQMALKERELNYHSKVQAFSEFAEKFSTLLMNTVLIGNRDVFYAPAFKAMLFSSPETAQAIQKLLQIIDRCGERTNLEASQQFSLCLQLLSKELTQDQKTESKRRIRKSRQ